MMDGLWAALGGFALVGVLALAGVALVAGYMAKPRGGVDSEDEP